MNDVQSSLRDGVALFRALLDDLRRTWESERDGIHSIYNTLNDAIKKQYDILLEDLDRYSLYLAYPNMNKLNIILILK